MLALQSVAQGGTLLVAQTSAYFPVNQFIPHHTREPSTSKRYLQKVRLLQNSNSDAENRVLYYYTTDCGTRSLSLSEILMLCKNAPHKLEERGKTPCSRLQCNVTHWPTSYISLKIQGV